MELASGNIFIRPNTLPLAGDLIEGHTHNFDHTTIVFEGAVHVSAVAPDGRTFERDFVAPSHFLVLKDVQHTITAIADNTVFWCIYSHRDPQGDVVQIATGWEDETGKSWTDAYE